MSTDNPWRGHRPDLSKLPAQQRKQLTEPIPLRAHETYGRIAITGERVGLQHPRGRIQVTYQREDGLTDPRFVNTARIDLSDFTARIPLVTVILNKAELEEVIRGALKTYESLGGEIKTLTEKPLPVVFENALVRGHHDPDTE